MEWHIFYEAVSRQRGRVDSQYSLKAARTRKNVRFDREGGLIYRRCRFGALQKYSQGACRNWGSLVLLNRMTKPFSLRARPSEIADIDARAAKLGQNRTKYILSLVRRDLTEDRAPRGHRFASDDLIGSMRTGTRNGNNATIRRLARRALDEKNR